MPLFLFRPCKRIRKKNKKQTNKPTFYSWRLQRLLRAGIFHQSLRHGTRQLVFFLLPVAFLVFRVIFFFTLYFASLTFSVFSLFSYYYSQLSFPHRAKSYSIHFTRKLNKFNMNSADFSHANFDRIPVLTLCEKIIESLIKFRWIICFLV